MYWNFFLCYLNLGIGLLISVLLRTCYHFSVYNGYESVFKDGGNKENKKLKDPTSSPVKCYFVRVGSNAAIDRDTCYILSNRTTHEGRCLFAHVHTGPSVANYMARYLLFIELKFISRAVWNHFHFMILKYHPCWGIRLSLILSKTVSLEIDWLLVKVEFIDEDYCLV